MKKKKTENKIPALVATAAAVAVAAEGPYRNNRKRICVRFYFFGFLNAMHIIHRDENCT